MLYSIIFIVLSIDIVVSLKSFDLDIRGEDESGYYIELKLGTPAQSVNLLVDTGSSNTAIAVKQPTKNYVKFFHYEKSNTLQKLDIPVKVGYTVGKWAGFLVTDLISVGDDDFNCTFACMNEIEQIFTHTSEYEGILGLAYKTISVPNSSVGTFFDALSGAFSIRNVFSIDLCGPFFSDAVATTSCGILHLGHVSEDITGRGIYYTPIIREWYYEVMLTDFKVDDVSAEIVCSDLNAMRSIIDTGATMLLLPEPAYRFAIKKIKSSVFPIIPDKQWTETNTACIPSQNFNISFFPLITLSLYHSPNSTFDLIVSPELYMKKYILDNQGFEMCITLNIGVHRLGTIIGSSVLKGFYVVFDRENKRVGFSNVTHSENLSGWVSDLEYHNVPWCKRAEQQDILQLPGLKIFSLCILSFVVLVLLILLIVWIREKISICQRNTPNSSILIEDDDDM